MYINSTSVLSEVTILTIQFEESNVAQIAEDQMEGKLNLKKLLLLHCLYVLIWFLVKQTKLFLFYKCT